MARTPLSEIERRNAKTLEYMHYRNSVTVEELAQFLNVSEVTVRRDLNYLLNEKMVLRSSAGRYSLNEDPSFDAALFQHYSQHHREKVSIAQTAISLIHPGTVIGMDSSTTVLELAKLLHRVRGLTVVTNNLFIPAYLCAHQELSLFVAGGSVYLPQNSTEGAEVCRQIAGFHYDAVFLSANAFDFRFGLSNTDYPSIDAKLAFVENAEKCIVLVDSSKLKKKAGKLFLPVAQITTVVTDSGISPQHKEEFSARGISLVIAE